MAQLSSAFNKPRGQVSGRPTPLLIRMCKAGGDVNHKYAVHLSITQWIPKVLFVYIEPLISRLFSLVLGLDGGPRQSCTTT